MQKFYCKKCEKFYYSSSTKNVCSVCDSEMENMKIGRMSISEKEKNKVNDKWDKLKNK
jgi:Zn finger protein HypA/HybF involved in hydrogenase expression